MGCSQPNLLGVDRRYRGSIFLGPRHSEKSIRDLENDQYYHVYDVPCGKCELCRVTRRYERALRIMLEAESWPESTYFITLTYDNENLGHPDLDHKDWAQFIKNFRQKFCQAQHCNIRDRGTKRHGRVYSKTFKEIKQVMCGEYGDKFGRKHFHGIIFNHDFKDIEFTGEYSDKGNPILTSKGLEEVWKKGRVQLQKVNFDMALYVSSYVTDAIDDENINDGHEKKQYGRFGRGIGLRWIEQYWKDVLVAGQVKTLEGNYPIPRYFLKKIEEQHPAEFKRFKERNLLRSLETRERLIKKGDGPLRRAKAKGRIFTSNKQKRRIDNERVQSRGRGQTAHQRA